MKWFDAARTRLRLILGGRTADVRADKEFLFHIEMEAERLVREKRLAPAEARRRALVAFGGLDKHKEALRDGRGTAWLTGLSLDLKLGARTLAKYPGVSIVGGLAMTIGVGLGAAYFEVVGDLLRPTLPFEEGERIVGLRNWDVAENDPELRSMADFAVWRAQLRSIQDVGAFRSIQRNVGPAEAAAEPAQGAEITPSAFRVVRMPALLGRTLTDADERQGASPVVVLGYDLWRNRFAGDPGVVGRPVRIGQTLVTAIGVMPEGFGFPVDHQFWVPLRANAAYGRREGPVIQIFGRLAPGATRATAQAELGAIGLRAAAEFPATHEHLRPRVMKYTELFIGGEGSSQAYLVQFVFIVLLLVLSSNVATMVFARMATREHEIAMRFALGAGRGRVLGQFFLESFVLALGATVVGLVLVARGADWITRLFWDITEGRIPFWLESGVRLNVTTMIFAIVLAVVAALVAGVVPALKATRSGLQAQLRHAPGAAASSLRFGGLWSAMIVVQVTFAVMVVPPAIVAVSGLAKGDHADAGFPEEQYMSARLSLEAEDAPTAAAAARPDLFPQFQKAMDELRRRLLADAAISQVTFASRVPGMSHPDPAVEVAANGDAPGRFADWTLASAVGVDYFATFGADIVTGRAFNAGDLRSDANVVIVNQHFVDEVLEGRNAVGRRVRYRTRWEERSATGKPAVTSSAEMREPGQWHEIIGVVENLGMDTTMDAFFPGKGPGIYHPLTREAMGSSGLYSVRMAFHVRGEPAAYGPKLREIAHAVDPALSIHDTIPLDRAVDKTSQSQRRLGRLASWIAALVALIALLVSVAGIYAVLSFTVARQTHDIGVRIALGADRRRIVGRVFSRAMIQIATGLLLGAVLWFYVIVNVLGGGDSVWLLMTTAGVLLLVGVLACGLPVRRALRIEPLDAIRTVG